MGGLMTRAGLDVLVKRKIPTPARNQMPVNEHIASHGTQFNDEIIYFHMQDAKRKLN
jgi:hypothetical protein